MTWSGHKGYLIAKQIRIYILISQRLSLIRVMRERLVNITL